MRRLIAALATALAVALAGGTTRADAGDTVLTVGYVISLGFSGVATLANGAALAYGQPSTRGWRILGITAGAIDLGAGTALFITNGDRSEGIVLGSLAVALGAAALTTGIFADEDVQVGVVPVAGGGLLTLGGRF